MKPVGPIDTVDLFPPLSRELLVALRALHPTDWTRPTICSPWTVKDVAAHLLGGNLGRLSNHVGQDDVPEDSLQDYDDLVRLIDRENALWVHAAKRISPEILVEFLELTDRRLYDYFKSLDPEQPARITVAWADHRIPPNWFDIAREYTEKWLHQQHIREAVGQPLLTERKWFYPVLETIMRGLPRAYRGVDAAEGMCISVHILGKAGGEWSLVRHGSRWLLYTGRDSQGTCRVQIDQDLAWRLFTRGIRTEDARREINMEGNVELGEPVLQMVSIMA